MQFSVIKVPSPDLGKAGMGSVPQGFYVVVILNSGAKRSVIQNLLQPPPMRHAGLEPVFPTRGTIINYLLSHKMFNYEIPGRSPE